jgi:hypothetical protein
MNSGGEAFDWGEVNLLDATSGQNLLPGGAPALRFTGAFRNWRRTSYNLPPEALGKSIRLEFKLISDIFTTFPVGISTTSESIETAPVLTSVGRGRAIVRARRIKVLRAQFFSGGRLARFNHAFKNCAPWRRRPRPAHCR